MSQQPGQLLSICFEERREKKGEEVDQGWPLNEPGNFRRVCTWSRSIYLEAGMEAPTVTKRPEANLRSRVISVVTGMGKNG